MAGGHISKYLDGPFFFFASILELTSKSTCFFGQKRAITDGLNNR